MIASSQASLFSVRPTQHAGRAVFATEVIPSGTLLLASAPPCVHVILRPFRREVCAQCFAYDRGREWKIRDMSMHVAFCSEACRQAWFDEQDDVSLTARKAVEQLCKGRNQDDDPNELVDPNRPRPTVLQITAAWDAQAARAEHVRAARGGSTLKSHRKALAAALAAPVSADTLAFLLSGILFRFKHDPIWAQFMELEANETPYSSADDLDTAIVSYVQLLAVLPTSLLDVTNPSTITSVLARDSHNSFSIRPSDDSEFLGYGVWPEASYFNHSCAPTVRKQRAGRSWQFIADQEIGVGEELCITYLGGEEKTLDTINRRQKLDTGWAFTCICTKCKDSEISPSGTPRPIDTRA